MKQATPIVMLYLPVVYLAYGFLLGMCVGVSLGVHDHNDTTMIPVCLRVGETTKDVVL